jgi:hypothetical protein
MATKEPSCLDLQIIIYCLMAIGAELVLSQLRNYEWDGFSNYEVVIACKASQVTLVTAIEVVKHEQAFKSITTANE